MTQTLLWALFFAASLSFLAGMRKASLFAKDRRVRLQSRPFYHGVFLALVTVLPPCIFLFSWAILRATVLPSDLWPFPFSQNAFRESLTALFIALGFIGGWRFITPVFRARPFVERGILIGIGLCSALAVLTTIGIVLSLLVEALLFFEKVSFFDFLFGLHWSPQAAFEAAGVTEAKEQNGTVFGLAPLLLGTTLITLIALMIAAPIGLMAAIYLSEYASLRLRNVAKPLLEVLAGIPTVVYGFFAALTVGPFFRRIGDIVGLDISSESALAAGVVMGIMIIPFVSSLSDDVITAVPQSLRDGSRALGATSSETICRVVLPAALPGIVSALILAVSRAVGETMIVVMAAGLTAHLTFNPFAAVTTVTVQIVTLLVGDQSFDSAKTLAAFALGLTLFCITLVLNGVALFVVYKYRERYE